jgi:hypothetical protein
MDAIAVVKRVVDLLINANVPPSEVKGILERVEQEMTDKYRTYTAEELLVKANEQIVLLRERLGELITNGGVTQEQVDAIIACLESKREVAIAKVADVPIIGYHLPMLAAISKGFLTASIQMPMVKYGDKTGTNYLGDDEITDEVELPEGIALWLTDVEDGRQFYTDETAPEDEETIIEEQGRLRIIATGAIALGIHTYVLARHNVDAPGSRFRGAGGVPDLCRGDGKPGLYCDGVADASTGWGSASCSSSI